MMQERPAGLLVGGGPPRPTPSRGHATSLHCGGHWLHDQHTDGTSPPAAGTLAPGKRGGPGIDPIYPRGFTITSERPQPAVHLVAAARALASAGLGMRFRR